MAFAQKMSIDQRNDYMRMAHSNIDSRTIYAIDGFKMSKQAQKVAKAEEEEVEFIFNPEGEEKTYSMSLYSYDKTNSKFVNAQSLLSQVRYAEDGKTVYFKQLTESLGVITWLKGEIDGDTIRVPFGQPLAYYKGQYLIFFVPMTFNDKTDEMEALDELKLIVKGDSLVAPSFGEGVFQAACGYVYISETSQGALSIDLDHVMRCINQNPVVAPADIEPQDYVYSFINSYGNKYKKKSLVKKKGNDLYMQLSTSAPDAYIHGTIEGDSINIANGQLITDSTFVYFYSLADPIYVDGQVDDFQPAAKTKNMRWWPETSAITSSSEVFSVDYMDGMEKCMDYVTNPSLEVYGGDTPARPVNPEWRSAFLDGGMIGSITFNYISFTTPSLDVDSAYINKNLLAYRIYINDNLLTFDPSTYKYLPSPMTDIPCTFKDNVDFWTYDQLHYVYLYMEAEDIKSIGIQTVYTVDGIENCSDIVTKSFEPIIDPDDPRSDYDLAFSTCRVKHPMLKSGETLEVEGKVINAGKKKLGGYNVMLNVDGVDYNIHSTDSIKAGKEIPFHFEVPIGEKAVQNSIPVSVRVNTVGTDTDDVPENNTVRLHYSAYDETLCDNTVLLEEFTSEGCGWCPYGAARIESAIENLNCNDRVIWICHHDGYSIDWLTAPESTEYTALFGGNTFAPAMMVSRNANFSDDEEADFKYPVFSIPMEEEIGNILSSALNEPTFVRLEAESKITDRRANITIKAEKNASFDGQCPTPYISVFVVEDSISPKKQRSYDSHVINYHHNAMRTAITDVWGNTFSWDGDKAEMNYEYEIPAEYKAKNLVVVAFIHEYNGDLNRRTVFNACQTNLADDEWIAEGIKEVTAEGENNNLYNIAGQRISRMTKGINIRNGKKYMVK